MPFVSARRINLDTGASFRGGALTVAKFIDHEDGATTLKFMSFRKGAEPGAVNRAEVFAGAAGPYRD